MFSFLNKKKKFTAQCPLTKTPLDRESVYAISTADLISSKKFWDNIMTEPETMNYTVAHFRTGDQTATNIRRMIFKKYANEDKVWFLSDAQLHLFDHVDLTKSKELANTWWDSAGEEIPAELSTSIARMEEADFQKIEEYAVFDAGKKHVKI